MLSIDEAIAHAKEQTEIFGGSHKEFLDNVAEWLEELKALRTYDKGYVQGTIDRAEEVTMARVHGYNKAIDEFAEKLSNECFEQSMTVVFENRVRADVLTLDGVTEIIFQIAQQLKAGGTDGSERADT